MPQQDLKKYDIFISYRRYKQDGKRCSINRSRFLFDELNVKYNDKVLRDVEKFQFENWIKQIVYGVENCKVFISIIEDGTFPDKYVDSDTGNIICTKSFDKYDKKTIDLYEDFSKMSIEDLVKNLTERVSRNEEIDFVRIEIGRALKRKEKEKDKFMFVPIHHRGFNFDTLPKDVQFRTNNAVDYDGDEFFCIINENDKDYKLRSIDDFLFLSRYSKRGKDICAKELYADKKRTESRFGFVEDFYCRREEVDGKLEEYINKESINPTKAFFFLTGRPGSGKTRAVYQLCKTGPLQNKDVIILRKDNIVEIANFVIKSEPTDSLYFLCDQIVDVFRYLEEDVLEEFVNKIKGSQGKYHLIATNTLDRLNDFLNKKIDDDILWNSHSYEKREIPPKLDDEFIDRLLKLNTKFDSSVDRKKVKTVADLIPGLNNYSKKIYEDSFRDVNEDFQAAWLKALQLVTIFRKENNPLFLAILVLAQMLPEVDEKNMKKTLLKCIRQMMRSNFFDLYYESDSGNIEPLTPDAIDKDFIQLRNPQPIRYDNEEIVRGNVLPNHTNCTFEIKELVWHYLEEKEGGFLYNFTDIDDVEDAIECWYNSFPKNEVSSLTRVLPRIPDPTPKIQSVVNNFVKDKLDELQNESEVLSIDELQLYGLLLGRSQNEEDVKYVFDKIKNIQNYLIHGNIVGEWYRYAKSKYISKIEYKDYVENTIRPKISFLTIKDDGSWNLNLSEDLSLSPNDLYNIRQEYEALVNLKIIRVAFTKLLTYVNICFDRIPISEGADSINWSTLTKRELSAVLYLCNLLALNSEAERDNLEELYKLLTKYHLFDENKVCLARQLYSHLARQADGNIAKCKSIVDVFFRNDTTGYSDDPDSWTLQKESDEFKKIFALFLMQAIERCANFENSIKLYELYLCALGDNDVDRFKVLTKVFRNCDVENEFSMLQDFFKDLKKDKTNIDRNSFKVLTNVMMEKAPDYETAVKYLAELDGNDVDSYSLFHILDKITKASKAASNDEHFNKALNVIEDERLSKFKSEGQILARLYQIANNVGQEKKVDEIAGEAAMNRVFVSIKMGKAYRSIKEVYELYSEFHNNQEKIYSDLFSSMVLRLVKEGGNENIRNELKENCKKEFYLKDSHYLLALIRLGEIKIFNDDKDEFSREFLANIDKLDTTDSWRKLIQEYQIRNIKKRGKQKMLCTKYIEEYIVRKYPYEMYPDFAIKKKLKEFQLDIDNYQKDIEAIWMEGQKKEGEKKWHDAIKLYLRIEPIRKYVATRLGQCYRRLGRIEDSVRWTLIGLDEGCFLAPYNLYMIYRYNKNKIKGFYDIDKAIDYLIVANERGNTKAPKELNKWFNDLKSKITNLPIIHIEEENNKHSISVLTIIKIGKALSISMDDWYDIGVSYFNNKHFALCVECYHLAADLGHTRAADCLWKWYQEGKNVAKNQLLQRRYLKIAAQFKNNQTAAKELTRFQEAEDLFQQGMVYYKRALSYNSSLKQPYKGAIEKFSEALSLGLVEASHYLGYCHFKGLGVDTNIEEAIKYYKMSAEQGYDPSQFSLGQIYEKQNMDEAMKWYQLAAEQGHEKAKQRLEQLNPNLYNNETNLHS